MKLPMRNCVLVSPPMRCYQSCISAITHSVIYMSISDALHRLTSGQGLPSADRLPRWLSPVPRWLENLGLRLVPAIIIINVLGTLFGFWYYGFHPIPQTDPLITWQFASEPVIMWPFVPDSPLATLFIALAFLRGGVEKRMNILPLLPFLAVGSLGYGHRMYLLCLRMHSYLLHGRHCIYFYLLVISEWLSKRLCYIGLQTFLFGLWVLRLYGMDSTILSIISYRLLATRIIPQFRWQTQPLSETQLHSTLQLPARLRSHLLQRSLHSQRVSIRSKLVHDCLMENN
jgi:Predicted membrane protein